MLEQPLSANSFHKLTSASSSQETSQEQSLSALDKFIAARRLAWDAAVMVQHPPHPAKVWQEAKVKWREAIRLLESIPAGTEISVQAKEKLGIYQSNYAAIDRRLGDERLASSSLEEAQTLAWQAAVTVQHPPHSLGVWQRASTKWQEAIALLEKVPDTTSSFTQAQAKLATYRENLTAIEQRTATEIQALEALKQFSEIVTRLNRIPEQAASNPVDNDVGLSFSDYTDLLKTLNASLTRLANQPEGKKHPIYPNLEEAIADFNQVTQLWQAYFAYKRDNAQWLYDDVFNQLFPLPYEQTSLLEQKYGVKTYSNGTKISLRFAAWAAWYHARQQVREAQQKVLNPT